MKPQTAIEVQKTAMFTGHRNSIFALEKSNDAAVFYSAGSDGLVVAWDLNDPDKGKLIAKVPNTVYAMCYVPDKHQLLVGQNTEGIHFIDLYENKEIASLKLTDAAIFDIKYIAGKIYAGTGNGELLVIDAEHRNVLAKQKLSSKSLRRLAISPTGKSIAAGYSDHAIRIFATEGLQLLQEISNAHGNSVFSLTYSPEGKFLVSGGRDAHLKVWNVAEMYESFNSIVGHMYTINDVVYSPNGNYFATCSKDKSIKVWHADTFRLLKVIDKARHAGHGTSVNKLLWLSNNKVPENVPIDQLISASDDNTISTWGLQFNEGRISQILGK